MTDDVRRLLRLPEDGDLSDGPAPSSDPVDFKAKQRDIAARISFRWISVVTALVTVGTLLVMFVLTTLALIRKTAVTTPDVAMVGAIVAALVVLVGIFLRSTFAPLVQSKSEPDDLPLPPGAEIVKLFAETIKEVIKK